MTCENCKIEMVEFSEGSTIGIKCPTCGYSIVTTNIDQIYEDTQDYKVVLKNCNLDDIDSLRIVSKILSCNFIETKKLLANLPTLVFEGKATDVKLIKEMLDNISADYEITPNYNY